MSPCLQHLRHNSARCRQKSHSRTRQQLWMLLNFFLSFTHLQSIYAKKKTCGGSAETLPPFVLTTCGITAPSALSHNMEEIRAITTSPTKGSYLQTLLRIRFDEHVRKSAKTTVILRVYQRTQPLVCWKTPMTCPAAACFFLKQGLLAAAAFQPPSCCPCPLVSVFTGAKRGHCPMRDLLTTGIMPTTLELVGAINVSRSQAQ